MDGASVPLGKQTVSFLPAVTRLFLLLILIRLILPQKLTYAGTNRHFTNSGFGFGLLGDIVPVSEVLRGTADRKGLTLKVDILPFQPAQLPTAHPRIDQQGYHGAVLHGFPVQQKQKLLQVVLVQAFPLL